MGPFRRGLTLATALSVLAACSGGGGGGGDPGPPRLAWTASRERGVNSPGGGYLLEIARQGGGTETIDLPYASGDLAPTSLTTTLPAGSYTVTLRAYAALDPDGGTTTTFSDPSTLTVVVP